MSGTASPATTSRTVFGELPDGTPVERFVLDDGTVTAAIITFGGVLQQVVAPDREGLRADVVLGFDDAAGYLADRAGHGAVMGRFANRIAGGTFPLNGITYRLDRNYGEHHIHGGAAGFGRRMWEAQELEGTPGVRLHLSSPDGDGGYPGGLDVVVEYRLAGGGALTIDYAATSTEPPGGLDTIVNLTNHAYFNLAGHDAGPVGDHVVEVLGSRYAVAGPTMIPTGELAPVDGTPLDLRRPRRLAEGWDSPHAQIAAAEGFDHTWALDGATSGTLAPAARIVDPASGRVLEVATDQPGSHLYTGNLMTPHVVGKGGGTYGPRGGFCVETQHFADSPNRPEFPSTVLAPGQTFRSTTVFRFTTTTTSP